MTPDDFAGEFASRVRFTLQKHTRIERTRRAIVVLGKMKPTPETQRRILELHRELDHDGHLFTHSLEDLGRLFAELLAFPLHTPPTPPRQ